MLRQHYYRPQLQAVRSVPVIPGRSSLALLRRLQTSIGMVLVALTIGSRIAMFNLRLQTIRRKWDGTDALPAHHLYVLSVSFDRLQLICQTKHNRPRGLFREIDVPQERTSLLSPQPAHFVHLSFLDSKVSYSSPRLNQICKGIFDTRTLPSVLCRTT